MEIWEITRLSLRVSLSATLLAALLALPLGVWAGSGQRKAWGTFFYTGMALPPAAFGVLVYLLLSRSGPLGGLDILFTPAAMILTQAGLAAPLVAGFTYAGVAARAPAVRELVGSLAGSPRQYLVTLFWESRRPVAAALAAGFGAAISEVGAATIVGGDIRHQTRVLTTALVLETRLGHLEIALALGAISVGIALLVAALLTLWQDR